MLANLTFHLKGTAKTWYDTNEATLTRWGGCKEGMIKLFGRPCGQQFAAKQELASRVQTSTEPYITYIQDVLALWHKVDDRMTEQRKVDHILKGIADEAFNLVMCKDCKPNFDRVQALLTSEKPLNNSEIHAPSQ